MERAAAAPGCAQPPTTLTAAMAAPASEHEILDVNRRYHDVAAHDYDAKWGIDYGEVGAAQVLGKLTKLLGPRPGPYARSLEIGAGTGYFSLNLLKAGVVGVGDLHRHLARDAGHARGQRAAARPRRRDRRLRRRRAAVRGRVVRPRARPRGAPPPARPRALVRGVRARAAPRRDAVLRRRAVAPGRPHRRVAEARRLARRAAVAQGGPRAPRDLRRRQRRPAACRGHRARARVGRRRPRLRPRRPGSA